MKQRYEPIWAIIDDRWASQLHRPLHAAAYYLNPHYHYSPSFKADAEVKIGFYSCLQRMIENEDERTKVDIQMDDFKHARGLFGLDSAKATRNKRSPADWWDSYGDNCPELKRFAIRILSLTCSSSGCERNWSAFEMVHSKRTNRLHQKKMNDLVFVMYNKKLMERQDRRDMQLKEKFFNFEDIPSDDEWITEKEDPVLPRKGNWLSVLRNRGTPETYSDESMERNVEETTKELNEEGGVEDLTVRLSDRDAIKYISEGEWDDAENASGDDEENVMLDDDDMIDVPIKDLY